MKQLDDDLKAAMLAGDKVKTETLRGLKNSFQQEAIRLGQQAKGLSDEQAQKVMSAEAKKRQEAAELYDKANENERAAAEKAELAIIASYLPAKVDEPTTAAAVKAELAKIDSPSMADMGKVIGAVRAQLGAGADGATIAKLVKQELGE
ncbi:GatB/YqeY domain-containing protein [Candidatus Saccharibacteria bacterium]|nr:GatB/YqeY domain-containing protein [Candidatus Saccharibacteria bacterium]